MVRDPRRLLHVVRDDDDRVLAAELTDEVLQELGFDADGIEELRTSGAVGKAKEHVA